MDVTETTGTPAPAPAQPERVEEERRTILDIFSERVSQNRDRVALRRKKAGVWISTSWNDWDLVSREIAGGLFDLGIEPGERVALLSNTRAEWVECEVGALKAGVVTVPIYPSNTPEQCEYILNNCGAAAVFVEDPHQLEKLLDPAVRPKLTTLRKVILIADTANLDRPDAKGRLHPTLDEVLPADGADRDWVVSIHDLREAGRRWLEENGEGDERLAELARSVDPDQTMTIIYTSGTTGNPKGVVITHRNMAFTVQAASEHVGWRSGEEQVLFLPLAHAFARVLFWACVYLDAVTAFAESIPRLIPNVKEIEPTFLGAVPRVYEKAYAKVKASFEDKRQHTLSRLLIDFALKQGQARSRNLQAGRPAGGLALEIADKLVFSKVRGTFGSRLKFFVSGGAPLAHEIAEFFCGAGIIILEGYGLTETTAVSHVNKPDRFRLGTVGLPLPGVEQRIAEDGEVLLRGPNIMKEYYGNPEATAEAIDADGWFHTGDVGVIEEGGFLRITDRKKDIIVTAGGKNVAPQNIENEFKALCPLASQMMVYGDKRKYLSALITLNEEEMSGWAREHGLGGKTMAEWSKEPKVRTLIQGYVDELNRNLASYESIKRFVILPRDFDQESGELTPTLKVKRKFCSQKYADILEGMYDGD